MSLHYLRAQYHRTRAEALDQVAYMDARNRESAERAGGVDALEGSARARFLGIQQRLIVLADADAIAHEYISALENEVGAALQRAAKAERDLRELRGEVLEPMPKIGYRDWLGSMVFATNRPQRLAAFLSEREARRAASRTELCLQMPQLF